MTIKKKRTIVSAFVALSAMAAIATSAAAATMDNRSFFSFHLQGYSDDYSSAVRKVDTLQTAYVRVDSNDFISSDRLYLRVCKNTLGSDDNYLFATETKWVNSPYELLLKYNADTPGVQGNYYRLRGYQQSNNDLYTYGYWEP